MFRKIGGILLLVLAAILVVVGVENALAIPRARKNLEQAVWLEENVCLPENEGKLVTLLVDPADFGDAEDEEWGLSFRTPVVKRSAEQMVHKRDEKQDDEDEDEPVWGWETLQQGEDALMFRAITGTAIPEGGLRPDPEFARQMPATEPVGLADIREESLAALPAELGWAEVEGQVYFTDAPDYCLSREYVGHGYDGLEGSIRIFYRKLPADCEVLALTGIQQGNSLVPAADMEIFVQSGTRESLSSAEDVMSGTTGDLAAGIALGLGGGLIAALFGLKLLGVFEKKQKEPEEASGI